MSRVSVENAEPRRTNPTVDEHDHRLVPLALTESIYPPRLHVDGADLSLVLRGKDGELNGAAPRVGAQDGVDVIVSWSSEGKLGSVPSSWSR